MDGPSCFLFGAPKSRFFRTEIWGNRLASCYETAASQRPGHGRCQQAGADCLDRVGTSSQLRSARQLTTREYPPRSASWIEKMEKRSRRRTRDLVTHMASQGLSENESGCARISIMARSHMLHSRAGYRSAGPIPSFTHIRLATHGRSIHMGHLRFKRAPATSAVRQLQTYRCAPLNDARGH